MNKPRFLIPFLFIILLDQLSKFIVANITVSLNTGISFGFLSSTPTTISTLILSIFIVAIYLLLKKDWNKYPIISGLFFGGAISNILDRLIFGGVRDWLPIPLFNITNNIADWAIFIGLSLFIFSELRGKKTLEV